jgi:hypothetical protein
VDEESLVIEWKNEVFAASRDVDDFAVPNPPGEGLYTWVFDVPRPVCGEVDDTLAGDRRRPVPFTKVLCNRFDFG